MLKKKANITTVLCCLVVIAILMCVMPGSLIYGVHWSMGMSFELPEDAPYGYYDVTVSLSGGECTKRVNDLFQVGYSI